MATTATTDREEATPALISALRFAAATGRGCGLDVRVRVGVKVRVIC